MKQIQIILIIVAALVILFVVGIGLKTCSKDFQDSVERLDKSSTEDLAVTKTLPDEYLSLIKPKYRSQVKIDVVRNSKVRNPVASLLLNDKYVIFIYKINLKTDKAIADILTLQPNEIAEEKFGTVYKGTDVGLFEFANKWGIPPHATKVHFSYNTDILIDTIKNDSIINFKLATNNVSIHYLDDDQADIIVASKKTQLFSRLMAMDVLFLKRKNSLFFLTLIPKDLKKELPQSALYNILTDN